jgi:diguanylate cyclase (GGDEF)-like protein
VKIELSTRVQGPPEVGWTHSAGVPPRALVISVAALAVPLLGSSLAGDALEQYEILIWLPALVPAFLLTYYRGWGGASLALAAAMATLTLSQVAVSLLRTEPWPWPVLLTVVLLCVVVCLGAGWIGELLHQARRKAEAEALRDPLTRLANRGHVNLFLDTAIGSAERGGNLAIVLMDLDHFKHINDKYGHSAGDATLVAFAQVLRTHTRRSDLSARFGGEEFISVLTGAGGVKGAQVFAERVRQAVRRIPFEWGPVTVSMGVAGYEPGMHASDPILAAADRALYQAKARGRDRVVAANEDHGEVPRPDGARAPAAHVAKRAGEQPPSRPRRATPKGPRVLVVAADEIVGGGLCLVLRKAGYRAVAARDGAEALERATRGRRPHLLLAEVVMPKVGGLTLAERVREANPNVKVLLMSGFHEDSLAGALPKEGVSCIEKPVSADALVEAVRTALDGVVARSGGASGPSQGPL